MSSFAIEVERRFLLAGAPSIEVLEAQAQADGYVVSYVHGFLPGDTIHERVTSRTIEPTFKRTVKSGTGVARMELEEAISEELFWRFWPLTEGRRLVAQRWVVRDQNLNTWYLAEAGESYAHAASQKKLKWELTNLPMLGLWLLEVETPTAVTGSNPPFPEWLAPSIVLREVTEDPRYEAFNLAIEGAPLA